MVERPDVCLATEQIFRERGFTPENMADLHIKHMRGKAPKKANYQALRDYELSIMPKQPTQIDQRISGGVGLFAGPAKMITDRDELPVIEGRIDESVAPRDSR